MLLVAQYSTVRRCGLGNQSPITEHFDCCLRAKCWKLPQYNRCYGWSDPGGHLGLTVWLVHKPLVEIIGYNLGKMRLVRDYNFASRKQTHSRNHPIWRSNRRVTSARSLKLTDSFRQLPSEEGAWPNGVLFTSLVNISWPLPHMAGEGHCGNTAPSLPQRSTIYSGVSRPLSDGERCGAVWAVPW